MPRLRNISYTPARDTQGDEADLQAEATRQNVRVHYNRTAKRAGQPYVELKRMPGNRFLQAFRSPAEAVTWLEAGQQEAQE